MNPQHTMIFLSLMKTYCLARTKEASSQINRCIHESGPPPPSRYSLNDRAERKRPSVGLSLKIISAVDHCVHLPGEKQVNL